MINIIKQTFKKIFDFGIKFKNKVKEKFILFNMEEDLNLDEKNDDLDNL